MVARFRRDIFLILDEKMHNQILVYDLAVSAKRLSYSIKGLPDIWFFRADYIQLDGFYSAFVDFVYRRSVWKLKEYTGAKEGIRGLSRVAATE